MSEKLGLGVTFPELTLNIADGSTLSVPSGLATPYAVLLFYRGHW